MRMAALRIMLDEYRRYLVEIGRGSRHSLTQDWSAKGKKTRLLLADNTTQPR